MTLLLDVTSLMHRRHENVMTGIDRVEYALAHWLCNQDGEGQLDCAFLVTGRAGHWLIAREPMTWALRRMGAKRGITAPPGAALRHLFDILRRPPQADGKVGATRIVAKKPARSQAFDWLAPEIHAWLGKLAFGRFLRLKSDKLHYLHASHHGLQWPRRFSWIVDHGVRATFFVHDLIPIDFPQYCSEGAHRSHKSKMETIARLGSRIATNSCYTADRIQAYFQAHALNTPPIEVRQLGAGPLPGTQDVKPAMTLPLPQPYFVCPGTIEGRKNVGALLAAWRLLARDRVPTEIPRLVLAGGRGWSNEALLADLDGMTDIAPFVVEVNDLNDAELACLMTHARAVLTPSLVEGSSLVPAEALWCAVPVIASDIAAHRELKAKNMALSLVAPLDIVGWKDAIARRNWAGPEAVSRGQGWHDFAAKFAATFS